MAADKIDQLERLAALLKDSLLTRTEYDAQNAVVLASERPKKAPSPPKTDPARALDRTMNGVPASPARPVKLGTGLAAVVLLGMGGWFGKGELDRRTALEAALEAAYQEAATADSMAGWKGFLEAFPEHPRRGEADQALRAIMAEVARTGFDSADEHMGDTGARDHGFMLALGRGFSLCVHREVAHPRCPPPLDPYSAAPLHHHAWPEVHDAPLQSAFDRMIRLSHGPASSDPHPPRRGQQFQRVIARCPPLGLTRDHMRGVALLDEISIDRCRLSHADLRPQKQPC